MSFIESPRFPDKISYGSSGGPTYSTDVITVNSGYETRNQNWVQSRHEYDAAFGVVSEPRLSELIDFFHAMAGQANEFRYKDWGDYLSCNLGTIPSQTDQSIGFGDSTDGTDETDTYQIVKNYIAGLTRVRDISKPINGTLLVEVDGVLKTESTHYNVDYTTGIITFTTGNVPLLDRGDTFPEEVKCGYEFDVPCRFGSDKLNINFNAYAIGDASVSIKEVRI